jgi:hypothetical protein
MSCSTAVREPLLSFAAEVDASMRQQCSVCCPSRSAFDLTVSDTLQSLRNQISAPPPTGIRALLT